MPTLDELLESQLRAENIVCMINEESRNISVPSTIVLGVESDERTNRVYFKVSKIVGDNVDLTKYQLNVNFINAQGDKDRYIVEDVKPDTSNSSYITFSWLLSRNVTKYKGKVHFIICALNTMSDGNVINEWNTTLASAPVLEGLEIEDIVVEQQHRDVINQLLHMVETKTSSAIKTIDDKTVQTVASVAEEGTIQKAKVKLEGESALASIPVDYTKLSSLVDTIDRTRSHGIVKVVQGKRRIELYDSSDMVLQSLKMYGNSTQETTKGISLIDYVDINGKFTKNDNGKYISETIPNRFVDGSRNEILNIIKNKEVTFSFYSDNNLAVLDIYTTPITTGIEALSKRIYQGEKFITTFSMEEYSSCSITLKLLSDSNVAVDVECYFMVEYGNMVSTWEKYTGGIPSPNPDFQQPIKSAGDKGTIEQLTLGANLYDYRKLPTLSKGNTTVTNNQDGTFTISGTGASTSGFASSYNDKEIAKAIKKGIIKYIDKTKTVPYNILKLHNKEGKFVVPELSVYSAQQELTQQNVEDVVTVVNMQYCDTGSAIRIGVQKPFITQMNVTEFEHYKESKAIISTLQPLRGIPVKTDGNYTDENGQQWVCDTIEVYQDGTGKRINRVGIIDNGVWETSQFLAGTKGHRYSAVARNNNIKIKKHVEVLCTNYTQDFIKASYSMEGDYISTDESAVFRGVIVRVLEKDFSTNTEFIAYAKSTNMVTLYQYETLEEVQLSQADIQEIHKLQTFKTNTLLVNGECDISIEYVADTKTYIDNAIKSMVSIGI